MQAKNIPTTVWVDVTTLLLWKGRANGIPRLLSSLLCCLRENPEVALRLCKYEYHCKRFEEVPWEAIPIRFRLDEAACASPTSLTSTALLASRAAQFHLGDTLLSIGWHWSLPGYADTIAKAKSENSLTYVPVLCDLIPIKFPHYFPSYVPPLFLQWTEAVIRSADMIATISRSAHQDLVDHAADRGFVLPPVYVMRLGDELPKALPRHIPKAVPADVHEKGSVLYVSTLEPRKNHAFLYNAWRRLLVQGKRLPYLFLVGHCGFQSESLIHQLRHDPLAQNAIVLLNKLEDAELTWLYDNCTFTVYPSCYEGWGLPVAESLARGKACLASDVSAIPEIGKDLADYHDPLDFVGFTTAVMRLVTDPHYRSSREQRITREYRTTTWHQCASAFLETIAGAHKQCTRMAG